MIKKPFLLSAVLMLVLLSFCIVNSAEETGKEYAIASNDILEITVYDEPDLSTTVRVAQDGMISYPLLGNIKVAGLTVRSLEAEITKLLAADYLVKPQVKVFVKQYAKISILGEVRNPGSYEMREKLTLTEAIALAQGFIATANTSDVKIIRTVDAKKETLNVDFDRILERALPDVELIANDVIIVEPYGSYSIIGQVARPGVYNLRKGLTIVEAIGLAGGFTPIAAQNGTKIFREEESNRKTTISVPVADIMASPDKRRNVLIKDKDTIVVPESFF